VITALSTAAPIVDIELQLLLEGVYRYSGYDFRDYTSGFIKRRVSERMRAEGVKTISALQDLVLHDPGALDRLVYGLSVNASELFKDPGFFAEFRRVVVPMLRTFPLIRAWIVGCATGEEAYSLAITMLEDGVYRRCKIYATDISGTAIALAKDGRVNLDVLNGASHRYRDSGGNANLQDYFAEESDAMRFARTLRENLVFSTHNLVSDGSFNEFQLIVCRNVLPQFNKSLMYRAHQVLFESLARGGYLVLGPSETVRNAPHQRCFERASETEQIYRRIR
jgi:chemotaxis protein methyltransferase CheR